jgi:hypothetical protein
MQYESHLLVYSLFVAFTNCFAQLPNVKSLFEFDNNSSTRWSSPENRNGVKGKGGIENNKAKGHPYDTIAAGNLARYLIYNRPALLTGYGLRLMTVRLKCCVL